MKVDAKERHEALRGELARALGEHRDNVSAEEAIAVFSQVIGHILLVQGPALISMDDAWKLIKINVEAGNQPTLQPIQIPAGGIQ